MRTFSISIFALILILLSFESASACSCGNPPTVEQSFSQSAAVIYGRVESVAHNDLNTTAVFKVEKSWKGADRDEIVVVTEPTSCGIAFKTGETHYLFLDSIGETYRTAACRRHAGTQEEFLKDKPTVALKPVPPASKARAEGGGELVIWGINVVALSIVAAAFALLVFAGIGIFIYISKKR